MTAPDVTADVRARFEAEFGKCPDAQLTRKGDGYLFAATDLRWQGYRAAHADLAGEVRELVEAARGVERRLIPLLSGKLHDIDHADFVAFFAALAKFHHTHQEKP